MQVRGAGVGAAAGADVGARDRAVIPVGDLGLATSLSNTCLVGFSQQDRTILVSVNVLCDLSFAQHIFIISDSNYVV